MSNLLSQFKQMQSIAHRAEISRNSLVVARKLLALKTIDQKREACRFSKLLDDQKKSTYWFNKLNTVPIDWTEEDNELVKRLEACVTEQELAEAESKVLDQIYLELGIRFRQIEARAKNGIDADQVFEMVLKCYRRNNNTLKFTPYDWEVVRSFYRRHLLLTMLYNMKQREANAYDILAAEVREAQISTNRYHLSMIVEPSAIATRPFFTIKGTEIVATIPQSLLERKKPTI